MRNGKTLGSNGQTPLREKADSFLFQWMDGPSYLAETKRKKLHCPADLTRIFPSLLGG